jgi:hypothetical protein
MHTGSQQSMNYTRWAARGAFLLQPRTSAQGSTLQQMGYARIGRRSLIGELTLHRVRAGPRRRASAKMAPGRQPSQHDRSNRREESRRVGAVGKRGLRRHAAAVDAQRRASITRPIVSIVWRPTSQNRAQTQSPAPENRGLRSHRCSSRRCCQQGTHWHLTGRQQRRQQHFLY